MRVESLRLENKGSRVRAVATVFWEDCDRCSHDIFFEVDKKFGLDLCCNPHAFLIACAIACMHYGEKRLFIDAEICPELRTGLETAMCWLKHWFSADCTPVQIETRTRTSFSDYRKTERAGFFFSGGIDSFAALRLNRLNFPPEHPLSIKDALLVYGLELDDPVAFEYVLNWLSKAADAIGISLIPVYTNIYLEYRHEDLTDNFAFWLYKFQGAALAAISHALSGRLTDVSIASTEDIPNLHPYGTHPLLDSNYSSTDLRIRHDGITLSRFAKTKLVAEWDVALEHLRVCNQYNSYQVDMVNCGKCEKCLRTMLALLATGRLDQTSAFPSSDVSEKLVWSSLKIGKENTWYYKELLEPLLNIGRHDLVRAIKYKLNEYHTYNVGWIRNIKKLDRKYFGKILTKCKRRVS